MTRFRLVALANLPAIIFSFVLTLACVCGSAVVRWLGQWLH